MTDLEELGYRILVGAPVHPSVMSLKRMTDAMEAAQRHRELHEIDVRRIIAELMKRERV